MSNRVLKVQYTKRNKSNKDQDYNSAKSKGCRTKLHANLMSICMGNKPTNRNVNTFLN